MTPKFDSPLGRQDIRRELKQGASEFSLSHGQSFTDQAIIREEAEKHRKWINSEEYKAGNEAAGALIGIFLVVVFVAGWVRENLNTIAIFGAVVVGIAAFTWLTYRYGQRLSYSLRYLTLRLQYKVRTYIYSDARHFRSGVIFFAKQWQKDTYPAFLYFVEKILDNSPELSQDWGRSADHFRKCLSHVSGPNLADAGKGEYLQGKKLERQKKIKLLIGLNFAINRALRKAPEKELMKKLLRLEVFVVERLMMYGLTRAQIDEHLALTGIFWKD